MRVPIYVEAYFGFKAGGVSQMPTAHALAHPFTISRAAGVIEYPHETRVRFPKIAG
jgi:hypothetical protein